MSVNVCGLDAATCALHGKSRQFTYENDSAASTLDGERMLRTASLSRPSFHVTAPNGWLNDPCGPGYDPTTGMYHLFFQWNPHGNDWGNMSWGHATSSDCVSWKTSLQPALLPSANYDRCGVFTGCLLANDIHGNSGDLTVIYTSVNRLPIHYTLPYVIGSESLSLAASSDGGRSWERQECNPILPGPPQHLSVTGWRDPSLATWSRGEHSGSGSKKSDLYGLISGGIVGKTPTVFLYKVNPTDLREWEFAGPLVNVGLNFHPSRWSGDFGVNWEVVNLMTLTNDSSDSRDFGIVKVEGGLRLEGSSQDTGEARHKRHRRGQHWMSIKPSTESGPTEDVLATYAFSGIFDHGCFYAANSFWDPQTSQNVVYGWFTEEDLPNDLRHRQGWSGMVSLPRVVRLTTFRNVKKARTSPLRSITSIEMVANAPEGGKFSIHTLGISPDPRLSSLRPRCKLSQALGPAAAEFAVSKSCERVGIRIAHNPGFDHCTTLSWHPRSEEFTIHRPRLQNSEINHRYESAPHTLFTFTTEQGGETEETLKVHAFFDKNVLEVFVNERTVISTRIYHPSDQCFGIRFFAESINNCPEDEPAMLLQAIAWDGLGESRR